MSLGLKIVLFVGLLLAVFVTSASSQTVLAEIDAKTDKSHKRSLIALRAEGPYRYLFKEFDPSPSKTICKIDYKGAEAKEVLRRPPSNLSLNELYLVANTYETGSSEFIDLFDGRLYLP